MSIVLIGQSTAPCSDESERIVPSFDHLRRRRELCSRLAASPSRPEVILVSNPLEIFYLTGVREGISWLAIWEQGAFAVTRHMLVREVVEIARDCEVLLPASRSTDPAKLESFVIEELRRRGLKKVAVETGKVTASTYLQLNHLAGQEGISLMSANGIIDLIRQSKDEEEISLIIRCAEIAGGAFLGLLEGGAGTLVGRSERDLAHELEVRMFDLGADRQGFPDSGVIVASGPNSASAHHSPGSRKVRLGEPLLIDWGAELGGYRSDMTRTMFPGRVADFAVRAYPVVETALKSAEKALKAGACLGEIDRTARDIVMDAGYPEFHYGLGHGVGLAIHEAPWIRAHSIELPGPGMITTLEPGVYLPGIGGIRIECLYSINTAGVCRIDKLPTSLESMILH